MAIQFLCPYGHRLKVPDHRAGKKGRCPKCQQRVIVPVPNPIPSGREKRQWDASAGERIEIDDQLTPPSSEDSLIDNPYLGGLIDDIETPRPADEASPESEQPSGPVISELELPPDIATFAINVPAPVEPPSPSPIMPTVPPLDLNAAPADMEDLAEDMEGRARPPGSEMMEGRAPSPGAVGAPQLPPAPPPLPPAPPSLDQPSLNVQLVHAPPPVPTASSTSASNPTPRPRWVARVRAELAEQSYRPNPQQTETVYWLASVLLFVIVFTAAPGLGYLQLDEAPRWAQAMLLVAGLQLAYSAWLAIVPDWSTVRVGMWVFGISAVFYAAASGWFGMTGGAELTLEYVGPRTSAAGWCGVSALVLALMSYACGQVCGNWRRADFFAYSASRRFPQT